MADLKTSLKYSKYKIRNLIRNVQKFHNEQKILEDEERKRICFCNMADYAKMTIKHICAMVSRDDLDRTDAHVKDFIESVSKMMTAGEFNFGVVLQSLYADDEGVRTETDKLIESLKSTEKPDAKFLKCLSSDVDEKSLLGKKISYFNRDDICCGDKDKATN